MWSERGAALRTLPRLRLARAAVFIGLAWAAAACTDPPTDINTNPKAPKDVPAEFLLPQAIRNSVQSAFGARQMLRHTEIWPQHFVQLQYPDEELGEVCVPGMASCWTGYCAGGLNDLQG